MPNPDTRPVWPTRDLRDLIYFAAQHLPDHEREQLEQLVDAWDAAPADATEAVARVLPCDCPTPCRRGESWCSQCLTRWAIEDALGIGDTPKHMHMILRSGKCSICGDQVHGEGRSTHE